MKSDFDSFRSSWSFAKMTKFAFLINKLVSVIYRLLQIEMNITETNKCTFQWSPLSFGYVVSLVCSTFFQIQWIFSNLEILVYNLFFSFFSVLSNHHPAISWDYIQNQFVTTGRYFKFLHFFHCGKPNTYKFHQLSKWLDL